MSLEADGRGYLFSITHWRTDYNALERHYLTFSIAFGVDGNQSWPGFSGMCVPEYAEVYPLYNVVQEFAGIAFHLTLVNRFDQFEQMFFDALQIAIARALLEVDIRRKKSALRSLKAISVNN